MFLKYDSVRKRFFDPDGDMVITPRPDGSGVLVEGAYTGGNTDGATTGQVTAAISAHNTNTNAHADIRQAIADEAAARGNAITAHNTDTSAHSDIRAALNSLLDGLPTYNASTHVITFTRHDGATLTIDLPLEGLQQGWDFDAVNKEFVVTKLDGTEIRIDAADFVKAYTGSTGDNVQIAVDNDGTIHATLLDGSIGMAKLTTALQAVINGKLDAAHNTDANAHGDIRQSVTDEAATRASTDQSLSNAITSAVSGLTASIGEVNTALAGKLDNAHNTDGTAHADIRAKLLPATIGPQGVTRLAGVGSLIEGRDDDVITMGMLRSLINLSVGGLEEWTQQTLPVVASWTSIAYGNGVFVAMGGSANVAAVSPDGIAWTQVALPTLGLSNTWNSIAFGAGIFVAVSSGSRQWLTSPDGINWTINRGFPIDSNSSNSALNHYQSIFYLNGTFFVFTATTTTKYFTSPNGITWTERQMPAARQWYSLAYGNGVFVAIPYNSADVFTSPDGIAWTQQASLPRVALYENCIAFGNGIFVVVVANVSNNISVMTSPDGITWTSRSLGWGAYPPYTLAYGNGVFVAVCLGEDTLFTSPDGINWTVKNAPLYSLQSMAYGNGIFLGVKKGTDAAITTKFSIVGGP